MKLNKLFLVGTALFAMTACVDNDDKSEWNKGDQAITFNASIQGLTTSRATGTQWATGDRIGVYMKATGAALTAATDANKQYTVSETGAMSASSANDALYFPTDKSAVDFIAYYPYLSTLADNTYKVDVSDQTNQPDIDLLYSNNATNVASGTPILTFTHQLSQIVLNLTKDNTIASLNGLTVKFTGMNTKADFTLADGKLANAGTPADINALVKDNQAAVIAIPAEALSEVKVVFELNGTTFTADYPQSKLEAGKKYVHKVLLKDSQGKPTVEFGTATITDWSEVAGGDINVDFGNGGTTPDPTPSTDVKVTTDQAYEEAFTTGQGKFTINDVIKPSEVTNTWTQTEKYGMKASAYVSGSCYATESRLESPIIDLTAVAKASVTFEHAINKTNSTDFGSFYKFLVKAEGAADWTELTMQFPTSESWTYISAGDIDLSTYAGKKIQLAFKYVSTSSNAGTWQIKNFKVTATENGGTVTPDPTDPSDPDTGTETTIFEETFGESVAKDGQNWPSIYDMDKWSNTSGMTFKDPLVEANGWSYSSCSVRSTSTLSPHAWFAANKESSMVISGFTTTEYKSLKLSYKIASNTANADQKCIVVKAGDTELTVPSATMTTTNKYQEVVLTGISANISSITFYSGKSANTAGIRIDDVKLIGIK